MKKDLLLVMVAFIAVLIPSIAHAQVSHEAAGIYNGTLTVSQDGSVLGKPSNENVHLTITDDTHVTLSIKNFSFFIGGSPIPLGDITIPEVELQKEEATINILPKVVKLTLQLVGEVTVHLEASTIKNQQLELALGVETAPPYPEMYIDVTFSGANTSTGIADVSNDNKPTVYYDTTTGSIITKGAENLKYEIYNLTGVQTMAGIATSDNINVSNLTKGIYLIKIGNSTVKFIKQ